MSQTSLYDTTFLDTISTRLLRQGQRRESLDSLVSELQSLRATLSPTAWKTFIEYNICTHNVLKTIHQDPLSQRAYLKPRGYAGDAVMLDYLYDVPDDTSLPPNATIAQTIHTYIALSEAGRAVCGRRHLLAQKIDAIAAQMSHPRILSLACGHLREAKDSQAVREGKIGRFVAVDQDQESLAVVEREVGMYGVEAINASVRDVLTGKAIFTGFDFVYAAGLYDYLALPVAQRLTEKLFAMLQPGGRLLLANFLPGILMAGYMEACMDWWLIYRTKAELLQCTETLPEQQIATLSLYVDEYQNIAYIEIERK